MYKLSKLASALLFGALISLPAVAADKAKSATAASAGAPAAGAVATVNGVAIPQSVANAFVAEQQAQGAPDSPELKNAVREELIRRELLVQEAKKLGLDKKPDVIAQADLARQAIFIRAFVQDFIKKHPISDEQLKAAYERMKTQMGSTEYKVRHILVEKEDDAKAIIVNLKKGTKFEELAKQSKDPGSREKGGDLGWNSTAGYVKPFGDAVAGLAKGKYTETPVKTDFGYHVILVEDSRPLTPPPLDQIKPQLTQRLQQEQLQKFVGDLRAKAKVD
ncbi:putative parvulin-type peptidyl-prolyl cis-trans isomerase [Candidatus Accumulibacter aalborgensis]|uniref:peptidylprolyl isomerase n=1 Tax=Candidatus Accumulibacter aalborgensis TaxID=1860102 RepID=A0A1A8XR59_9PROT|nr:peptidylprolyl isomerase [Candidatus Accumulibacter aalborgensis]SBT06947.1 putative parvulin-type peptidyl-prolyl cis-trans isomerase [Candidatus Accumulibacter aalborgensis]